MNEFLMMPYLDILFVVPEQWMQQAANTYQEAIVKSLLGTRDAFLHIRYHMQQMGQTAGVPVSFFVSV